VTIPPAMAPTPTAGSLLEETASALASRREAHWVVAKALGVDASQLYATVGGAAPAAAVEEVRAMAARRLSGEPIQYVLGTWAFRTLEVVVDPRVLIPRPETEVVVEVALDELRREAGHLAGRPREVAVDAGTGSGVIALSLAVETAAAPDACREIDVWATDESGDALDVARVNLSVLERRNASAAGRVRLARGSWFAALPDALRGHVHVIASNPPYVGADEYPGLDAGVRQYEPIGALVAGPTGREALEALLDGARSWLCDAGSLVLEIAPRHADFLIARAADAGYEDVRVMPDLAGRDRVLVARVTPRDGASG